MDELVQVLRAYLHAENGERIRFAGELYEIDANVQPPVLGELDIPAGIAEHGWVITAIDDDDPKRANDDGRKMIGFYLTVKTYDPMVELFRWGDAVAVIRSAFAKGDMAALAGAVTDEMLEQIAVCGTTADATQMLRAKGEGLARDVVFLAPPSFLVSERRRAAYACSSLALLPVL